MNNDHGASSTWVIDEDQNGVVFELIFGDHRFGLSLYPNKKEDCGWWLVSKGENLKLTNGEIPENILLKLRRILTNE